MEGSILRTSIGFTRLLDMIAYLEIKKHPLFKLFTDTISLKTKISL